MQIIVEVEVEAGVYASEQYQSRIKAPSECPDCGIAQSLEAHGYYWRWVSETRWGKALRIAVRRFFVDAARRRSAACRASHSRTEWCVTPPLKRSSKAEALGETCRVGASFWGAIGEPITSGSGPCAWNAGRCLVGPRRRKRPWLFGTGSWRPAAA